MVRHYFSSTRTLVCVLMSKWYYYLFLMFSACHFLHFVDINCSFVHLVLL